LLDWWGGGFECIQFAHAAVVQRPSQNQASEFLGVANIRSMGRSMIYFD